MKNEKIKDFLTKLVQEEDFKDEFLKIKEKVEKKGFSKEVNEQFISEYLLPWSKKLGYELTKKDFIDFDRTQKPPRITGLSPEQLENVSGGFGFNILLSFLATFGSLIFGDGDSSNAKHDLFSTDVTSYSQTGVATQDYYGYHDGNQNYARASRDDYEQNYANSLSPTDSPLSARKNELYKKLDAIEDNYRFLEERGDDRTDFESVSEYRNIIQIAAADSTLDWVAGAIDAALADTYVWRGLHIRNAHNGNQNYARASRDDHEQNYANSLSPTDSPLSARKNELYKQLDAIEDNYRFLKEHGSNRTDSGKISKYRNIIQNAATDRDLDWVDRNIGVTLGNTNAWREQHIWFAAFNKVTALTALIDNTWQLADASRAVASSLVAELNALYYKTRGAETDDTLRTNGFEEEWKQLEDKIHSAIEEYKSGESPLPKDSNFSARKNELYKKLDAIEDNYRFLKEHGNDRTDSKEISKYRNIIQNAATDRDLDWVDRNIGVTLGNTNRWREQHIWFAAFNKTSALKALINAAWPIGDASRAIGSSLVDELYKLYNKTRDAETDDTLRTNGFEEEWKQLEDKIHSAIEEYKSGKSPLPKDSNFSARKNELYKQLDAIEDNYRFLEERGDERTDFEKMSKCRNIIQNAATDDSDFNWAANSIDVALSNTNAWREMHLRKASFDKVTELTALINDTWPSIYADSTPSSLLDEVQRLYSKAFCANTSDAIRTNGFEEEWKQLEDKIHSAIEDYKYSAIEDYKYGKIPLLRPLISLLRKIKGTT